MYYIFFYFLSVDADSSITELGHWLVALKDIKFDMSSITKLVEFVKRYSFVKKTTVSNQFLYMLLLLPVLLDM